MKSRQTPIYMYIPIKILEHMLGLGVWLSGYRSIARSVRKKTHIYRTNFYHWTLKYTFILSVYSKINKIKKVYFKNDFDKYKMK